MTELIGHIIGNYRVESLLGAGGMGQVFRARHIHLDRPVALKVMHAGLSHDPGFQARFRQEARAIAALQHPHIIEVYDFGEQNGLMYLVMELLSDGSLRGLMQKHAREGKPWPLMLAIDLAQQAAEGLAYAHSQGMIHRDIKPDNMLLRAVSGASGRYVLKITDFGLARMAEGSTMTATGTAMGTPAYMSPEQCQGAHVDHRSDIYALGVVLYEVTTGYLPFTATTLSEAAYKHVFVPPTPPRHVRADLPEPLEAIVLRCLAKRPEDRFASAAEVAVSLKALLAHPDPTLTHATVMAHPNEAPPVSPPGVVPSSPPAVATPQPTAMAPSSGTLPPAIPSLPGASTLPRIQVRDASGSLLRVVELTTDGVTVGRQSINSLVLESEGVSRSHLRVDWDGRQVTVTDLGSSNGTLLGATRLPARVAHPWGWREVVRVGPFWLRLEPPPHLAQQGSALLEQLLDAQPTATPPPAAVTRAMPTGMVTASVSTGRIGVVLDDASLTLTPGQPAPLRLTLANLGTVVDHFNVEVEGAPQEWVRQPADAIQLMPGVQAPVVLTVTAPRTPASRAGDYQVTLRVRSRENPAEVGVAHGCWTVLPFMATSLILSPKRAAGRGQARFTTTLRNDGNAPIRCTLRAEDDEHALRYRFEPPEVTLDPGAEVGIPTTVSGPQRWFGREQTRTFTVGAAVAGGEGPLVASGQFVQMPIIPAWAITALFLLIPLCMGGVFFGNEMFVVRPAAATATAATAEAANLIAAANTSTAAVVSTAAQATVEAKETVALIQQQTIAATPMETQIAFQAGQNTQIAQAQQTQQAQQQQQQAAQQTQQAQQQQQQAAQQTQQAQQATQQAAAQQTADAAAQQATQAALDAQATQQAIDAQATMAAAANAETASAIAAQQTILAQTAAVVAAQQTSVAATATTQAAAFNAFLGNWANVDTNTSGMTRLVIDKKSEVMYTFRGYGKCTPSDCDWGEIQVPYMPGQLVGVYDFGFKKTRITVRLQGEDLLAEVFDDYLPTDPRPDRTTNYVLRRQWILRPDIIIRPDILNPIILATPTLSP
ncbi:protein kinase domain-containing protein [Roseiflexus sp.]|uniref:protein kinase domain-containing protein n=1 Tax=Roseiflexus sp. TaxID=2562120 RepID=UPI00398B26D8